MDNSQHTQNTHSDFQQNTIDSLSALISNDPSDSMNPIFQDILDSYINIMNMTDEQVTNHAANVL